jgi:long-subunit fatty acid transport protein
MNLNQVKTAFVNGKNFFLAKAGLFTDLEVDTRQTGSGNTLIFGINVIPVDKLNIGIKYEHKTKLALKNDTRKDDAGLPFLENEKVIQNDIPAIISIGASYRFSNDFEGSVSFVEFLDKDVSWSDNDEELIDRNSWNIAMGFSYKISEQFSLSAGGIYSSIAVNDKFQNDLVFTGSSQAFGLGVQWRPMQNLELDAGVLLPSYNDIYVQHDGYADNYSRTRTIFALGAAYKIL